MVIPPTTDEYDHTTEVKVDVCLARLIYLQG